MGGGRSQAERRCLAGGSIGELSTGTLPGRSGAERPPLRTSGPAVHRHEGEEGPRARKELAQELPHAVLELVDGLLGHLELGTVAADREAQKLAIPGTIQFSYTASQALYEDQLRPLLLAYL